MKFYPNIIVGNFIPHIITYDSTPYYYLCETRWVPPFGRFIQPNLGELTLPTKKKTIYAV